MGGCVGFVGASGMLKRLHGEYPSFLRWSGAWVDPQSHLWCEGQPHHSAAEKIFLEVALRHVKQRERWFSLLCHGSWSISSWRLCEWKRKKWHGTTSMVSPRAIFIWPTNGLLWWHDGVGGEGKSHWLVTIPWAVQKMWKCSIEGLGFVSMLVMGWQWTR